MYPAGVCQQLYRRLCERIHYYQAHTLLNSGAASLGVLNQADAVLITYGDQLRAPGSRPLSTLARFCYTYLHNLVSAIHLLPFYPYTSDDGFSVSDYRSINPDLGDWEDVAVIGQNFRLMFDAVINHISVHSEWFKAFLQDDPRYRDYFIVVQGNPDLSQVVRPRALPLLTPFQTASGERQVWTTFSADQADLNYHNYEVLLEIIDILLFYASQGAELIRLDAIAYLWKEIGTGCIHLPQTHLIIRLFRAVLDLAAPQVMLITETNVPHVENISYFGDGTNEAQLVYNFALPPLVLYTLHSGDAHFLSMWARSLSLPSGQVTFFNFLASHDGIGIVPVRGILPPEAIDILVQKTLSHGGLISYKHNPDGSKSPYELNINYFDALCDPREAQPLQEQVDRFMAAQAIMLALVGVPGIYFHSLFGSLGWPAGVPLTGKNRTINREKLLLEDLERELSVDSSRRFLVYDRYKQLLIARSGCPAFHPFGVQRVIECGRAIFALLRSSPGGGSRVLCLQNVSNQARPATLKREELIHAGMREGLFIDIIRANKYPLRHQEPIILEPYQTLWLEEAA